MQSTSTSSGSIHSTCSSSSQSTSSSSASSSSSSSSSIPSSSSSPLAELSPRQRALVRLRKERQTIQDALEATVDAAAWPFVPDYSTPAARKKTKQTFMELLESVEAAMEPFLKQLEEWEKNLSAEDREFLIPTDEERREMEEEIGDVLDDDWC